MLPGPVFIKHLRIISRSHTKIDPGTKNSYPRVGLRVIYEAPYCTLPFQQKEHHC